MHYIYGCLSKVEGLPYMVLFGDVWPWLMLGVYKHLTVICAQKHQKLQERHFPRSVLSLYMHLEENVLSVKAKRLFT